jgi:hypothetical protein
MIVFLIWKGYAVKGCGKNPITLTVPNRGGFWLVDIVCIAVIVPNRKRFGLVNVVCIYCSCTCIGRKGGRGQMLERVRGLK